MLATLCSLAALAACDGSGGAVSGADAAADASPPDVGVDRDEVTAPDIPAPPLADATGDAVRDASPDTEAAAGTEGCPGTYGQPSVAAYLDTDRLIEASGLAASRADPTLLWTHNDSGSGPVLSAIGTDGHLRARVTLTDASSVDWEDIARAPCPDGSGDDCLWVGDLGDEYFSRDDLVILVLPEPVLPAVAEGTTLDLEAPVVWRFPVVFPDDPIDAEALFVSPAGDAFWLIEKVDDTVARLYAHPGPLEDGVPALLEEIAAFPSPGLPVPLGLMLTGADLHPSGTRLVIRGYTGTYEYRLGADGDLSVLADLEPLIVALGPLSEGQGEAVSYDAAGTGLWTLSEDPHGGGFQPLHHYACRPGP